MKKVGDEQYITTIHEVGWDMNKSLYVTVSKISHSTMLCSTRNSQREVFITIPVTLHFLLM